MKAIVDTNVVLDVLLDREPFVKSAVEIFGKFRKLRDNASGFRMISSLHKTSSA